MDDEQTVAAMDQTVADKLESVTKTKDDAEDEITLEATSEDGDEEVVQPSGYSSGEIQMIYAYYGGKRYIYDYMIYAEYYDGDAYISGVGSKAPDDIVYIGKARIVTQMPTDELEASCLGEGTDLYYSADEDVVFYKTDNGSYRKMIPVEKSALAAE